MIPKLTLRDGTSIPQIGFGTLNVPPDRTPTPENTAITAEVVALALRAGFRLIDTAQMYGNERGVGDGIAASGVAREEVYVTSKLGNGNHRPEDVHRSFGETLVKLGLERLDLFLMHWPLPSLYDGDYVRTWKAMADLVAQGKLVSAGVSNFQPAHLERIIGETGIVPVINQIEIHPRFNNDAARQACERHGIAVQAWSPLGQGKVLDDGTIARIAARHGRSSAQIMLRWQIQHHHALIVKSLHSDRMRTNLDLFGFDLTPEEMGAIDALDQGESGRIGPNPDTFAWVPSAQQPGPTPARR
jgi:2,5-diketo-D-gluconate reductase A